MVGPATKRPIAIEEAKSCKRTKQSSPIATINDVLPPELLIRIFFFVKNVKILRESAPVCRLWNEIISNSPEVWMQREIYINVVKDIYTESLPSSKRFSSLDLEIPESMAFFDAESFLKQFTNLKSLSINYRVKENRYSEIPLSLGAFKSLSRLFVGGILVDLDSLSQNLQFLEFDPSDFAFHRVSRRRESMVLSVEQLDTFLKTHPLLEYFFVNFAAREETLSVILPHAQRIRGLRLHANADSVATFINWLKKFTKLDSLQLIAYKSGPKSQKVLLENIQPLKSLTIFSLQTDLKLLHSIAGQHKQLESLHFSNFTGMQFPMTAYKKLAAECPNLKSLWLGKFFVDGKGIKPILSSFNKNGIRDLRITWPLAIGATTKDVFEGLQGFRKLDHLSLECELSHYTLNCLSVRELRDIAKSLEENSPQLEKFQVFGKMYCVRDLF